MVGVEVSPHASDIINKECLLANTALNGFIPSFGTTGDPRQPGVVLDMEVGGPACGRGLETDDPRGPLPTQAIL